MGKNNYACILKVPPLSETRLLQPGFIILQSSRMVPELCELSNSLMGIRTKWTCKIKDSGRLLAQCPLAGHASRGKENGIRIRHSQKVGCTAVVRTLFISSFFGPQNEVTSAIRTELTQLTRMFGERPNETIEQQRFCVLKTVKLEHKEHSASVLSDRKLYLGGGADVLEYRSYQSQLRTSISH